MDEALWRFYLLLVFSAKLQIHPSNCPQLSPPLSPQLPQSKLFQIYICNLPLPSSWDKICPVSSFSFLYPFNQLNQKPWIHSSFSLSWPHLFWLFSTSKQLMKRTNHLLTVYKMKLLNGCFQDGCSLYIPTQPILASPTPYSPDWASLYITEPNQ